MSNITELRRRMPQISADERELLFSKPTVFYTGFDNDDITRLIMYRRAIQAGYYRDHDAGQASVTPYYFNATYLATGQA